MTTTTIVEFEIVDHGIDNSQYFQGCGVEHTIYSDVATGCGSNPAEAVDDALEQLACAGWDCDGMEKRICKQYGKRKLPRRPQVSVKAEDCYYYVSIRVKA